VAARRVFFALWPEAGFCEALLAAVAGVVPIDAGRAIGTADLHVTFCFLGAVDESILAALCDRAAKLEASAFELEFEALEYWAGSRVLAATSAQLPTAAAELARKLRLIAQSLGLSPDERPLRPHVTLLRALAAPPASAARLPLAPPLRLEARCFYLAQSHELEPASASAPHTRRYRTLGSWPLRPADR
jgi:RNA 2',3'-cyclic 3'-phosphodiesterase